jgi:hypothetical protein
MLRHEQRSCTDRDRRRDEISLDEVEQIVIWRMENSTYWILIVGDNLTQRSVKLPLNN